MSNLHAAETLIDAARARGIPPARMICTGDVAACCAHPRETLAPIMALGCPAVQGNCEQQLAATAAEHALPGEGERRQRRTGEAPDGRGPA